MTNVGNLKVTLPSDREIAMTRLFDAPRHLVWDAFTKPELVKRWLGVHNGWTLPVCEIDLKVGGTYRYVWRGPDGGEMGMRGVYREIVWPERIVSTEAFDQAWYAGEAVGTVRLVEDGGKTILTITVLYQSPEVRDAVLKSPMKEGVALGYDKLAEILASIIAGGLIDPPRILEVAAQATAVIRVTVPRADIRKVMGPGIGELTATVQAQGIVPTGRWFTHHFRMDPDVFDFEIGVPVPRPVTPVGRVTNGQLPAATVARTIYHGGYEGLPQAWPQLDAWIAAQRRKAQPGLWETYVTDPAVERDSSAWQTELTRPLVNE